MNWLLITTVIALGAAIGIIGWQLYYIKTRGPQPTTINLSDIIEPKLERSAYAFLTALAWLTSLIFLYLLFFIRRLASGVGQLFRGAEKKVGRTIGQTHRQYLVRRRRLPEVKWRTKSTEDQVETTQETNH